MTPPAAGGGEPGAGHVEGDPGATGADEGTAGGHGAEAVSDFGISTLQGPFSLSSRRAPEAGGPDTDPRFALSAGLRRIISATVGRPIADEDIREAARAFEAAATALEAAAAPGRRPRSQPDPVGSPQDFFPTSPVIGFANPIAPPVVVELSEAGLEGSATFDYQYEGPPTCVHGGVIAMVFDELLGAANIAAGCPGMTGTLTIRYRKPTPLRAPLRLEARVEGREGRKIRTWGGMFQGDVLLAEAEGIFIELVPERFLRVILANTEPPAV